MNGILIITVLSVQSSFRNEIEEPVSHWNEIPDTVQWWITDAASWRIRTYALDHDIHVFSVGNSAVALSFAKRNTHEFFGDVIKSEYCIELIDTDDQAAVDTAFREASLPPRLDSDPRRFVFWNPDGGRYHTQSRPKD